ncbi:hypothetical protein HDU83_000523 [Entophlyctis luteolus]|nr:hypothetical protein HDU83_000523 [Entophlyctis luteolus]
MSKRTGQPATINNPKRKRPSLLPTSADVFDSRNEPVQLSVTSVGKLSAFLRKHLSAISSLRSAKDVETAIRSGNVEVNGRKVTKPAHSVQVNDTVTVLLSGLKSSTNPLAIQTNALGVRIVKDTSTVSVVWKPAGVCAWGNSQDSTLLQNLLPFVGYTGELVGVIPQLASSTAGLVVCCKNEPVFERLKKLYDEAQITETWTVLCSGNVSDIRGNLAKNATFTIDSELDGEKTQKRNSQTKPFCSGIKAKSMCTYLSSSRSRNYKATHVSTLLLSPVQETRPAIDQAFRHLSQTLHPPISPEYVALTGLEFKLDEELEIFLPPPRKFANLLVREHEAWKAKREDEMTTLTKFLPSCEIQGAVSKLDDGSPLPYILGFEDFSGLRFVINENVMIPRRGTEILVERVVQLHKGRRFEPGSPRILDLGTGSGCLLVSILARVETAFGVGIDISKLALEVARRNASMILKSGSRAAFGEASFLSVSDYLLGLKPVVPFDCIVTNPPYLSQNLWESDRLYARQRHEPHVAVVSGVTGTEAYEEIRRGLDAVALAGWLEKRKTRLFVEVNGESLGAKVIGIFEANYCSQNGGSCWKFIDSQSDAIGVQRCVEFLWE